MMFKLQGLYSIKRDGKILMTGELIRIWKLVVMIYLKVLSLKLPEENHEKLQLVKLAALD
jgi:hypothetical protein